MPSQAAQFDLSTAFLDQPKTLAYGLVRGAGNLILQQELADKTRVAFYMLGEGRWDSILRLWINSKLVTLPSATTVHFHPGGDGEIGNGLTANSTGGDQHVDQFFTLIPGGLDPITFSRYAWLALKVAPDPGAPSAQLTVLADYQAMQVRQFDASGNQTAFAWTQNWGWIICDFLIRKFVLREGKINQPLVAAELARFDWASFSAAATYYDAVLSGGQKRFSDGGVVYLNNETADRALEQMLLMCRSYILERNGKLSLYADQPRASVFTFTSDNVQAASFKAYKSANLRAATNRLSPTYRDYSLASGSSDDATRFAITSNPVLDHEAHQRTVGVRGAGLSVLPKVTNLALDLGVNTPERVWRILKAMLVRQLGDDVDANNVYNAPWMYELTGFEDSLAVEPGDVVTIDPSISEEHGGRQFEVLQPTYDPSGPINYVGLEYMPNAFPDVAPGQQTLQAPTPGTGLAGNVTATQFKLPDPGASSGWYKLGTWAAGGGQQGCRLVIEVNGTSGYNADINTIGRVTAQLSMGNTASSPNCAGYFYTEGGNQPALLALKAVATGGVGSGQSWDVYANINSFVGDATARFTPSMNSTFLWIGAAASDPGSASSMIAVMSGGTRVIDHTGVLDAPAVDFSRGYTNKHLDNIPDGSTYARPLSSRVSSGKPLIDFGEAIHLNKSLDNVPDGTRAAWASTTQKNAAVDANGNLLLKNISNGIGTTSGPTTSSTTYAVVPEMTQTITTKGNKVLLTFSTSLTLAEINDVGIFGFFRDGVQISQDYVIGTAAVGGSHAEIVALTYIDSPSAASHTFDVRWKVSNASELLTASGTARTFQVVELG